METVNQLINKTITSTGIAPSLTKTPLPKQNASCSEEVVNQCIEKLKSIFTGWRATFKTKEEFIAYRKEFLFAMIQFGVSTQDAIERGTSRARTEAAKGREFLPSGSLFAKWCQPTPEELGVEPFYPAFRAVIFREWEKIHPAFQHLCAERRFDLRKLPESQAKTLFAGMYDEVVRRVASGQKFERIVSIEKRPFSYDEGCDLSETTPTPREPRDGYGDFTKLLKTLGGQAHG